jgi:hypothetical protein
LRTLRLTRFAIGCHERKGGAGFDRSDEPERAVALEEIPTPPMWDCCPARAWFE